jgi:hypothetical protein
MPRSRAPAKQHGDKLMTKARGRTADVTPDPFDPTKPNVPQVMRREASRPIGPGGGGKHRGDRRDTSPTYTGNQRHAARGNTARADVKTRKR